MTKSAVSNAKKLQRNFLDQKWPKDTWWYHEVREMKYIFFGNFMNGQGYVLNYEYEFKMYE